MKIIWFIPTFKAEHVRNYPFGGTMLYHKRGCITTQSNDFRHPTEVQSFLYSERGWCLQRANPDWIRCTDWQTPQWVKRWKVTGTHLRILLKLLPNVELYTNFMLGRALPTVICFEKEMFSRFSAPLFGQSVHYNTALKLLWHKDRWTVLQQFAGL